MATALADSIDAPSTIDNRLPHPNFILPTIERRDAAQQYSDNHNITLSFAERCRPAHRKLERFANSGSSPSRPEGPPLRRVESQPFSVRSGRSMVRRIDSHEPLTTFASAPTAMSTARKVPDTKLARRPKSPHPCAIVPDHHRSLLTGDEIASGHNHICAADESAKLHQGRLGQGNKLASFAFRVLSKSKSKPELRSGCRTALRVPPRTQLGHPSRSADDRPRDVEEGAVMNDIDNEAEFRGKLVASLVSILPNMSDRQASSSVQCTLVSGTAAGKGVWVARAEKKGKEPIRTEDDQGRTLKFKVSMKSLKRS